ncbi:Stp1/IreP family PP2C-type Ser/Thr phosphatase [Hazenella sp. IB182357]|uniref:Stp1/IreP family PP2C-type Ser/Thr phosphatase n=1 Tax=Polycladospora coralii TaxID=2771432 RepID=A0A926N5Y6_9BACL|nr:Stp1/IreP family PP2C-type Ser/Thr phosphatase [Polycladospora coralii]MBD1371381.1 Stp1/IreP family PP2C-type Ser/Thr phosphatase [Polycladospora coralii]MBS7530349.1 Stp1/IreP family PP2C-type Ser/Thr phosphatase [Polycladospora coralii]
MEIAKRTDVGRVREINEDSLGLEQLRSGHSLAIVADGMGGHLAGDVASQTVVKMIMEGLLEQKLNTSTDKKSNYLLQAIGTANDAVFAMSQKKEEFKGMGTTAVAAIVDTEDIVLGHVGDSRAYLLHNGGLYQLTEDHSYVNLLKKHGQITEEEAKNHPQRNMIVRAVGSSEEVEVDLVHTPWKDEDILLLCTDGLTTMVEDREIGIILSSTTLNMEEKADHLIQLALDAGGTDNISLILLKNKKRSATS